MAYVIHRADSLIASGWTEHAAVSGQGKIRRIPKANRERLSRVMVGDPERSS
jgi:acyl-CoA thioesterase FadM